MILRPSSSGGRIRTDRRQSANNQQHPQRAPHHRRPPPRRRAVRAAPSSSSSSPPSPADALEAALEAALADLTPDQRLLPAYDDATSRGKRRALDAVEALEEQQQQQQQQQQAAAAAAPQAVAPAADLLPGEWELALAGSGTVVTRTPLVRLLSRLSRGSDAYGLGRIRQVLRAPAPAAAGRGGGGGGGGGDVLCRASNEAELRLGPLLGSWRVAVRGAWRRPRVVKSNEGAGCPAAGRPLRPGALVVDVAFDELLIGPLSRGGRGRESGEAEEEEEEDRRALRLPLPQQTVRSAASSKGRSKGGGGGGAAAAVEWATTYASPTWRVGRGVRSGNVFVFRRAGAVAAGGGGGG